MTNTVPDNPSAPRISRYPNVARITLAALLASSSLIAFSGPARAAENGDETTLEEVVVTGIRGSLKQALDKKRDSNSIVDGINSLDIGKFPDKNVADSLQRVPGVSVDRIWGEGRDIFVRGTGSDLNRTLMNGQNVASAYWWANDNPSRGFNYSILASELVASLEVYKSPMAKLDEGSIGGAVNVITRRPMDLDPLTVMGSVEGQYSKLPDKIDPQASGLVSWKNDNETFAILGSYNYQKRTVRRDGLEGFPTNSLYDVEDQDGNVTRDVYAVWGGGSAIFQQKRERKTANLVLQFRPTDQWDIVVNAVRSDMDMDNNNQNYLFVPGGFKLGKVDPDTGVNSGEVVVDPVFITTSDGKQAIVGGTFGLATTHGVADEPIYRESSIKAAVYDMDMSYEGDGWRARGQIGYTTAEGGSEHDRNYWFEGNSRIVMNLQPDVNEFSFPEVDPNDGSQLRLMPGSLRDWVRKMEDDEFYAQTDVEYDLDNSAFTSLEFGVKFRSHTIENNRTNGSVDTSNPANAAGIAALSALTLADLSSGPTPTLHGATATEGSLTSYAFMDIEKARAQVDAVLDGGLMTYTPDLNAFFNINEKITSFYTQANFETGNLRGNVGVRMVHTNQTSKAYQGGSLQEVNRKYTEFLPSLNLVYNLRDDVLIRAAASRAMARPTFQNLSANLLVDATTPTASGGNPFLKPTFATQFEAGFEWYYDEASIFSATVFRKDLSSSIRTIAQEEVFEDRTLTITRPFNSDGADITGLEVQLQHDFGMGIGALANYTLTEASVTTDGKESELPGNSKHQMNASVYYEDDTFSVRLSYNYRSESFSTEISGGQLSTAPYDQFDATATWHATDQVDVFMNAVNITNEVIFQRTNDGIPVGFYENGPRYSVGVRFRY
ncbi:TonB-dependent receptor [Paremcibacter congregatus]|uniref:TonB-dependent receptor n=1 Tax=Paremcibacter congregatus TaxID=2043170 RepID=UPI003A8DE677